MREATVCHLLRGLGQDTEVLLCKRQSLFFNGVWNGPGGKLEPGETIFKCGCRETKEEVGLRIDPTSMRHYASVDFYHPSDSGPKFEWRVHFLSAARFKGTPALINGFSELGWFKLTDLPYHIMMVDQKEWLPAAIEMFGSSSDKLLQATIHYGDAGLTTVAKCEIKFVDRPLRY